MRWIVYGTLAGIGASGGRDLLRSVLGSKTPPVKIDSQETNVNVAGKANNSLPTVDELTATIQNTGLDMAARRAALETLRGINPLAALVAEGLLNELATRPQTHEEAQKDLKQQVQDILVTEAKP